MAGEMDKLKGKVKEVAGAATGDEKKQAEGKMEQAKGSAKNAAENVKEHAKEHVDKAADKAKELAEKAEREMRHDPDA